MAVYCVKFCVIYSLETKGIISFCFHLLFAVNKIDEGDIVPSASAKDLLKQHSKTLLQKKKEVELLTSTPTLGKGIGFGQEISLDAPINKGKGKASAELAKVLMHPRPRKILCLVCFIFLRKIG
jgi:hypothetical protein